jgi:Fe-S-cluster containining protein
MSRDEGDALCTACGLCCDGTFHGKVVIDDRERRRLARVGLPVLQDPAGSWARLPCSALRGALCSVYEDRPRACAGYACLLRTKVDAGGVTLGEARRTIAALRSRLVAVREAFVAPASATLRDRILSLAGAPGAGAHIEAPDRERAEEAVSALLDLARAEFEPTFDGGASR